MKNILGCICIVFAALSCGQNDENRAIEQNSDSSSTLEIIHEVETVTAPSLVVLGTVQDAGSPQIDCQKECCQEIRLSPDPLRMVVSLGFIDPENKEKYLFEASPDMPKQLSLLEQYEDFSQSDLPNGVFLTHAHIGHYTGLMYFGKEAKNASEIPVFAMPRMTSFLKENGPWSQLVNNNNISLNSLQNEQVKEVNSNLSVEPILVPHRDEFSETVGYKIIGPNKTALFIPDIDKWQKWERDIRTEISNVDYAFLDATFYSSTELPNRDISEIPHPLISESMEYFEDLSSDDKSKVYFIHFNHTNPVLNSKSDKTDVIEANGFNVARVNDIFKM